MRYKVEMDTTDNPKTYRNSRKRVLNRTGAIKCSLCPYHRHENATRHAPRKSWKFKTKKEKQYKKAVENGVL